MKGCQESSQRSYLFTCFSCVDTGATGLSVQLRYSDIFFTRSNTSTSYLALSSALITMPCLHHSHQVSLAGPRSSNRHRSIPQNRSIRTSHSERNKNQSQTFKETSVQNASLGFSIDGIIPPLQILKLLKVITAG